MVTRRRFYFCSGCNEEWFLSTDDGLGSPTSQCKYCEEWLCDDCMEHHTCLEED